MSSPISVDIVAMQNAEVQLTDAHGKIQAQVSAADQEITALAASWGGGARDRFMGAFGGFLDDCKGILTDLEALISNVNQARGGYTQTDSVTTDAAASFEKQMSSGLPGF